MKRIVFTILLLMLCLVLTGFKNDEETKVFDVENLYDYQKAFKAEEIESCAGNSTKTYMDYRATTARDSRQYVFIHNELTVDESGFLYDEDGFIGVALGSYYGEIGDRFYFTLDSGIVLPLVKCEEKADVDTDEMGCYHVNDNSIIEFVIDKNYALDYFGRLSNDYVLNGNYNNYSLFRGNIIKVEKVLNEKNENYVTYIEKKENVTKRDIFNYASGY